MPLMHVGYDPEAKEGGVFEALPQGTYDMKIASWEQRAGKEHAQLMIQSEVIAAEADQTLIGRKSTNFFSFSPKACKIMKSLLDATGIHYEIVNVQGGGQSMAFDPDHLIGKTFRGRVIHEIQQEGKRKGQPREQWFNLEPSGFGGAPGQQPMAQPGVAPTPYAQPPQGVPQHGYAPGAAPQPVPQQQYVQQPQQYVQQPQAPAPQGYPQPSQVAGQGQAAPAPQPYVAPGQPQGPAR